MENKTKIKIINPVMYQDGIKIGDEGYIDGYCRGGNDVPYAVIVIPRLKLIALSDFYSLEVIN